MNPLLEENYDPTLPLSLETSSQFMLLMAAILKPSVVWEQVSRMEPVSTPADIGTEAWSPSKCLETFPAKDLAVHAFPHREQTLLEIQIASLKMEWMRLHPAPPTQQMVTEERVGFAYHQVDPFDSDLEAFNGSYIFPILLRSMDLIPWLRSSETGTVVLRRGSISQGPNPIIVLRRGPVFLCERAVVKPLHCLPLLKIPTFPIPTLDRESWETDQIEKINQYFAVSKKRFSKGSIWIPVLSQFE